MVTPEKERKIATADTLSRSCKKKMKGKKEERGKATKTTGIREKSMKMEKQMERWLNYCSLRP